MLSIDRLIDFLTKSTQDLGGCFVKPFRGVDGSACCYVDTILGTAVLGLFLMGGTLLLQCSLCCARYFPCLECCGICWGEPACGGRLPTKRRKKQWVFRCEIMLFLAWAMVFGVATLGWRTTVQLNYDVQKSIEALELANQLQNVFRNTTNNGFANLKAEAAERMKIINRRLSSINNLTTQTQAVNATLVKLLSELESVRSFIEGRRNDTDGENRCTFYDRPTGRPLTFDTALLLWRLPDGNVSVTTKPPGKHKFGIGRGQQLINNRTSPTCTHHNFVGTDYQPEDLECPCCLECVIFNNAVEQAIQAQPTPGMFAKLSSQRLPVEFLEEDVTRLQGLLEGGIQVVEKRMADVQRSIEVFKVVMLEVSKLIDGVQFFLWGMTWFAEGIIFIGIIRGSFKLLLWGYIVGTIACVFILFPAFGFGALVVLPFGDACSGIPRTGGDTSSFLSTFSQTGNLRDVNISTVRMIQDCLATTGGNVWNVAGMDRNVVFRGLKRFDIAGRVSAADVATTLNTDDNDLTLAFSNNKDAMERLTADNKIYGYDSAPTGVDPLGYTTFAVGGVIDGSTFDTLVNIVNVELVSTYTEIDLVTACQSLATNPLTDACYSNNTARYDEICCPVARFATIESRVPAQKVVDYNIYRRMLQQRMQRMQQTLISADDQLVEIKRSSLILKSNITYMQVEAYNEVERMADQLMEIASCQPFNQLYESLRIPFCQNLNRWVTPALSLLVNSHFLVVGGSGCIQPN